MSGLNPNPAESAATLQARLERLTVLYEVSNTIHSTLDPHAALNLVVTEATRVLNASSGSLALINPTSSFLEIQASHGLPANAKALRLRVGEGVTGWVARTGKTARVGDVAKDARYIAAKAGVVSELAVPLLVDGELRGVINLDSDRPNAFSEADARLLNDLAVQASRVIKNTWLYEQNRLKARLFESLVNVGKTINSTLSLDQALRVITREACELMGSKMCSLLMVDEKNEWLDLRASHGAGPAYLRKPRLSVAESLIGTVVRRRKPMQVENVQTSTRYQSVDIAREEGLVALLSVPLTYSGKALGALSVYSGKPHSFSNEEIRILSGLAEMSAIAIEKARLYERLVDMEEHLRQSEKLSAIGLLAAEVAHEIRNPLTVMKMLYQSMDLKFPAGDPRNRDVAVIGEKMDRLNKIVEQILDFARTSDPEMREVNVNKLIEDLGLLTRHKLANQKIQFAQHLEPGIPDIRADHTQLEQVFLNLMLNAAESMPQGGRLSVVTRVLDTSQTREHGRYVVVEFRDSGEGMTEEQRKKAFTSLLTTTKKKGTGLGLAIVGRIIEAHRGKIKIRSKPGGGTTMSVFLPA